jgi:hypothetical protein
MQDQKTPVSFLFTDDGGCDDASPIGTNAGYQGNNLTDYS